MYLRINSWIIFFFQSCILWTFRTYQTRKENVMNNLEHFIYVTPFYKFDIYIVWDTRNFVIKHNSLKKVIEIQVRPYKTWSCMKDYIKQLYIPHCDHDKTPPKHWTLWIWLNVSIFKEGEEVNNFRTVKRTHIHIRCTQIYQNVLSQH